MSPTNDTVPARLVANRYRLEARLGTGGMGSVFRAFDTSERRYVALKQMRTDRTASRSQRAELRFRREYHTLASLRHPRIVQAFEYGVDPSGPYYTLELLDGEDLQKVRTIPVPEICALMRDVAAAVALLHARGLVHRDLAPRNVRRTADGHAKLIDFGVLANVGVPGEVAGTPAYIAPESVRGQPIDGRTDLYSLGALTYLLITGRVPFPAREIDQLERAWRKAPAAPSALAHGVPPALDELVLSLLCLDPLGRPASAGEVIDRLTAIADLPPADELEVKRGYLASAAMIGRRAELELLRERIARAVRGEGGGAFIAAESGTGKSRLLREVSLEAQLAGATVLSASCETAAAAPYGALAQLVTAAVHAMPVDAAETLRPHAPRLLRIFPWLSGVVGPVEATAPANDPAEERLRALGAVSEWLIALAVKRPLVLLVDDVQRSDEASAAALAALVREAAPARLLVVCALRTGERVGAQAAVEALARVDARVELAGLRETEVAELVRSLFGDVPNSDRLATQMHSATGGSPLHCTEMARYLVDSGTVRYANGTWVIPHDLPSTSLGTTLAAAMDGRVAGLGADARALGEVLGVHGGALSIELCADLAPSLGEERTFAALDELTRQGVLVGDGASFRFRHDGLREALLRGLGADDRRALHRRVGEHLLLDAAPAREAEIGWHLTHGGDEARGAALLERAGRQLFEAQALSDCIAPLEQALAVLRRGGAPPNRTVRLERMLLAAGWVSNRQVGSKYAEQAVLGLRDCSGMALADRLGPVLGRLAAFFVGVSVAGARWIFTRPSRRGPSPMKAVQWFGEALAFACGLANAENRLEDLKSLVRLAEPFAILRGRIPYAIYLIMSSFPDILRGRLARAERLLSESVEIIARDRMFAASEAERAFAEAAARGLRALVDVNQFHPRLLDEMAVVEKLGSRYYELVAQATRVNRFRYRGEEAKARDAERAMEASSLALGSWSTDVQVLVFGHPAYSLHHDVNGLRRSVDELERRIAQGFRFEERLAVTRADLVRELGRPEAALEMLEALLPRLVEESYLTRQYVLGAACEAALAAGRFELACSYGDRCVELGQSDEGGVLVLQARAVRCLGLAEAERGNLRRAAELLDRGIRDMEVADWPSMAGQMHEARARVALRADDRTTYALHCALAVRFLRATDNPALIAIAERLVELGAPGHGASPRASSGDGEPEDGSESATSEATVVSGKPGSGSRSRDG